MKQLLLVGLIAMLCNFLFSLYCDAKCAEKLPPGYELEVSVDGKYRPIYMEDGRVVFWIKGEGTKCEAIERAWEQYQFNKEEKRKQWKKTK